MTSTDFPGGARFVRLPARSLAAIGVSCLVVAATAQEPASGPAVVRVTALSEGARANLGQETLIQVRAEAPLSEAPLALQLEVRPDAPAPQAALRITGIDAVVVVEAASLELRAMPDVLAALRAFTDAGESGVIDVYHSRPAPAAMLLSFPGGHALVHAGAVRLTRGPSGVEVVVGDGRATVFAGALPAGGIAALTGGVQLTAGENNAVLVGRDGQVSGARRLDGATLALRRLESTVVQRSLLPELVRLAERVAEGDIEPPTRGARIPAPAIALDVRPRETIPRGGLAAQVIGVAQPIGRAGAPSTAATFLSSRVAALAVVGARLERTRIIGSPGAGGGVSPLRINPELRAPFTPGRRSQ